MTDLRAAVLARLADLLATCDAATPGPWEVEMSPFYITAPTKTVTTDQMIYGPDKHHIAAHSPSVMRPVWEVLAGEVVRHGRFYIGGTMVAPCAPCQENALGETVGDACPFLTRLAAALGVSPDEGCAHVFEGGTRCGRDRREHQEHPSHRYIEASEAPAAHAEDATDLCAFVYEYNGQKCGRFRASHAPRIEEQLRIAPEHRHVFVAPAPSSQEEQR